MIFDIQRALIKIMGFGIDRKVFRYEKKNSAFIAENTSRNSLFSLLFYGMLSICIFAGLLMVFSGEKMTAESIVMGFVVAPLLGILGLRKFLWMINGKEILRIGDGMLSIEKNGTFWTKKRVYKLSKIRKLKSKFETDTFLSMPKKFAENYLLIKEQNRVFLFFTVGEFQFNYLGSTIRVFSDLNDLERLEIIEEIKHYL